MLYWRHCVQQCTRKRKFEEVRDTVVSRSLGEENIYMILIFLGIIYSIYQINTENKLNRKLAQSDSIRPHIHILFSDIRLSPKVC